MYVEPRGIHGQPESLVIDDHAAIKLLFSQKYARVLDLIVSKELSASDIARSLKISPGSAHYHLKVLEKYGLVRQVREEIKGGTIKKYYLKAARRFDLSASGFKTPLPDPVLEKIEAPVKDHPEVTAIPATNILPIASAVVNQPSTVNPVMADQSESRRLLKLIESTEMPLSDIARSLGVSPAVALQQLRVLEKQGQVIQAREDVKYGVVRKFYRSTVVVPPDLPDSSPQAQRVSPAERVDMAEAAVPAESSELAESVPLADVGSATSDNVENMLKYLGFFGYAPAPERADAALRALESCDDRMKLLLKDIQRAGIEHVEEDRVLVYNVYLQALIMRMFEDGDYTASLAEFFTACDGVPEEKTG